MREKPLILTVDDDNDFRGVLVTKLRASGFDVEEAHDGMEGFERAKELKPDLILMDVKMPKLDGIESLLKIKAEEGLKDIRVIFLTAFGDMQPDAYENDQTFAKEVGAYDYVVKTQDLDQIVGKVQEVLAK